MDKSDMEKLGIGQEIELYKILDGSRYNKHRECSFTNGTFRVGINNNGLVEVRPNGKNFSVALCLEPFMHYTQEVQLIGKLTVTKLK